MNLNRRMLEEKCHVDGGRSYRNGCIYPEADTNRHQEPRPSVRNAKLMHVDDDSCTGKPEGSKEVAFWRFDEAVPDLCWIAGPADRHESCEYEEEDNVEDEDDGSYCINSIKFLGTGMEERGNSSC